MTMHTEDALPRAGTPAPIRAASPAPTAESIGAAGGATHAVYFYEHDDVLGAAVANFLAAGLSAGEPLIVIATEPHRRHLSRRLASTGVDVEHATQCGQVTWLDARETLATFMEGPVPDAERFGSAIGGLIDAVLDRSGSARESVTVRAYGEMADLLRVDGNTDGAIRLEELWNGLQASHNVSLLLRDALAGRDRPEQLLVEQTRLLELIATGRPLDECLSALCAAVRRLNPHVRASILLADVERGSFHRVVAPDLPRSFHEGLADAPINDLTIGAWSTVVDSGQPGTCTDIAHDETWSKPWRDLCMANGIRACYSAPVPGVDGSARAVFMLCFDAPHVPTEWEQRLVDAGTHVVSIALERDRASRALRESEQRYHRLFESMDEGFCIIEKVETEAGEPLDFRYTHANPAFAVQSGVGGVIGRTIRQAFPGEPQEWFETYDAVLRTGEPIRFERDLATHERVLELYAFRVEDDTHRRVAVIFKDVTGRKRAERALEEARAEAEMERGRLAALVAQAPAAIAVLRGPQHVYELANQHYQPFIGHRDILGKPIREALPELEGQGIYELLDQVYRTGEPFTAAELGVMLDHQGNGIPEERSFNLVYQPIREANGSVSGIFVHAIDITEQVRVRQAAERLQREAEEARREAEAANRAKSEFLAAMSHELRTPLNAIAGYVQLVELGVHGPVTTAQHEALDRVQKSQQHLLSLINDVLNFAKLEAGRIEYDVADVSLADAMADVMPMVEPQFATRGLAYAVEIPPGLVVRADREKLQQVLLNLLSNAVKFTERGGQVTVDVGRREEARPGVAFLRVTDTGCGIPREKQEVIFDPFVQVPARLTRSREGTGLGLAISRDLARGMGGDLRVRSVEGTGATFTLSLSFAAPGGIQREMPDCGTPPRHLSIFARPRVSPSDGAARDGPPATASTLPTRSELP